MKTDSGKLSVTKKLVKIVHPFWVEPSLVPTYVLFYVLICWAEMDETVTLINYQTIKKVFL